MSLNINWKELFGWLIVVLLACFNWMIVSIFAGPLFAALVVAGVALLYVSPIGSWLTAKQMRGRKPTRDERTKIEQALNSLLSRSTLRTYRPRLWVLDQQYPNAWAFGIRDLAVTRGLLKTAADDELEGVIAHELGHLTKRHTLIMSSGLAVTTVGNIVSAIASFCASVVGFFAAGASAASGRSGLWSFLFGLFLSIIGFLFHLFTYFVNWIGRLALLAIGRMYEYDADKAAVALGGGSGLLRFLIRLDESGADMDKPVGLLAAYTATHPPLALRIDRIKQLLECSNQKG